MKLHKNKPREISWFLWHKHFLMVLVCLLVVLGNVAKGQSIDMLSSPDELKKMSLEDLMDIQVTLVSKQPEKLNDAASIPSQQTSS